MNGDHRWNWIKKLMLDGLDMTGLYSHKFHIYHIIIIIPDSAKSVESSRIQPPEKLTLDFQCVVFLMIETHLIGLKYAGVRKQILHVQKMHIYIYTWNYIYVCICTYYKIYLRFTIYTLYSIHPYWKRSEKKLEAPDRTWWSLKVEEKILGNQGANL